MAAQLGMDPTDSDHGTADAGGDRLACTLERIVEPSCPSPESEIASHCLRQRLPTLSGDGSALAITVGLCVGLVEIELSKPIADLAACSFVQGRRARSASTRGG